MKLRSWLAWIFDGLAFLFFAPWYSFISMKPRSWRAWIFGGLALLFLLVCVGLPTWAIHQFGWDWTGFNGGPGQITIHEASQDKVLLQAKTLWDWSQLLIVPLILAGGATFFTLWSTRAERQIAQQRYERDQELALDKQREDLLQSYLDRMADLLLEKGLRDSQPSAEVRKVARTRTVSTLIQLDGKRARTIFVFLNEAQLTEEPDPILSFEDADLSNAKWSEGNLSGFNLSKANLNGANLSGTKLNGAKLNGAKLNGADLSGANLYEADLSGASLGRADLSGANLYEADLSGANLYEANLSGASLDRADLSGADLSGAKFSRAALTETNLSGAKLNGAKLSIAFLIEADLSNVLGLESAQLNTAILRGVKGLTPEQLAHCKASGAFVEEAMPSAPPSQSAAVAFSQETISQASPLPDQAVPSTHRQEATPEDASSQEHTTVEKRATPSTLSSQDHATPLSSSQETSPRPA